MLCPWCAKPVVTGVAVATVVVYHPWCWRLRVNLLRRALNRPTHIKPLILTNA